MAISVTGFTGTVNQAQWSENSAMAGQRYATADYPASGNGGTAGLAVTAAAGSRAVNVATGKGIGHGVTVRSDAVVNLALATPAAGRWYKIVVHRDWTTSTASIIALPWDTTTNVVPTAAGIPTTTAVGEAHVPGTGQDDQPLAAAWVNASNTTVTVFDLRTFTLAEIMPPLQALPARITLLEQTNTADLDSLALLPATSEGRRMHVDELNADFVAVDGAWSQMTEARMASISALTTAYAKAAGVFRVATATARVDGDNFMRRWSVAGSAWMPWGAASFPMTPTTAASLGGVTTGITIQPDGWTYVNGVADLVLGGVFRPEFRSYELEWELDGMSVAVALIAQLCVGNTATATGYFWHTSVGLGTARTEGDAVGASNFAIADHSSTNAGAGKVRIFNPATSGKLKQFIAEWSRINSAGTAAANGMVSGWQGTAANVYDSIRIVPTSASNFNTARVRVRAFV